MLRYAVLVDGGFVSRKLGTRQNPMTAKTVQDFIDRLHKSAYLADKRLHRVYYYDATPLVTRQRKPLRGGIIDFGKSERATRQHRLYEELVQLPFFAVRSGECTFAGWSVSRGRLIESADMVQITAADLQPQINQKGVDMRIGMDIASLTLKKLIDIIVLVTGDSDFVPAMKFARREGAQLFLAPLRHGIRESMREHSDLVLDIV